MQNASVLLIPYRQQETVGNWEVTAQVQLVYRWCQIPWKSPSVLQQIGRHWPLVISKFCLFIHQTCQQDPFPVSITDPRIFHSIYVLPCTVSSRTTRLFLMYKMYLSYPTTRVKRSQFQKKKKEEIVFSVPLLIIMQGTKLELSKTSTSGD